MNITCLLGNLNCGDINPFLQNGEILSLSTYATILGIFFGAMQFMETNPLRALLFRRVFRIQFVIIAIISLFFIVFSGLLPFLKQESICFLNIQRGLPGIWEILSLGLLLSLIGRSMEFMLHFASYIPNFENKKGAQRLYNIIDEIMIDEKNIKIISNVLNYRKNYQEQYRHLYKDKTNIERIIEIASKNEKNNDIEEIQEIAIKLIEDVFSNKVFCEYVATQDKELLIEIIKNTEKYKLRDSQIKKNLGRRMFLNIRDCLFNLENSFLSRELNSKDIESDDKEVYNTLFKSHGLVINYSLLSFVEIDIINIDKIIYGLKIGLEDSNTKNLYDIILSLSYSIGEILNTSRWTGSLLVKQQSGEKIYRQEREEIKILEKIRNFVQDLDEFIQRGSFIGEKNNNFFKHTFLYNISKFIIRYIQGFKYINYDKDSNEIRMFLYAGLRWLVFYGKDPEGNINKNIIELKDKFLFLLEEELKWDGYYNLGKFFLQRIGPDINSGKIKEYDPNANYREFDITAKFIEDKFNTEYAEKFINDIEFRKQFMPEEWKVDDNKIYVGDIIIYPKQSLETQSED